MYFKINDRISLKLRQNETYVYIDGKEFNLCKYLLLNIPEIYLENQNYTYSIDEFKDLYKETKILKNSIEIFIAPEEEFWAHCSNLQAWVEHDFDTRLIHSSLAFTMLRELSKNGDPSIITVFKGEIEEKFLSSYLPTILFLIKNDFLNVFEKNEILGLLKSLDLLKIMDFSHNLIEEFIISFFTFLFENNFGQSFINEIEIYMKTRLCDYYSNTIDNFVKSKRILLNVRINSL